MQFKWNVSFFDFLLFSWNKNYEHPLSYNKWWVCSNIIQFWWIIWAYIDLKKTPHKIKDEILDKWKKSFLHSSKIQHRNGVLSVNLLHCRSVSSKIRFYFNPMILFCLSFTVAQFSPTPTKLLAFGSREIFLAYIN